MSLFDTMEGQGWTGYLRELFYNVFSLRANCARHLHGAVAGHQCVFTLKDVAGPVELLQVAECGVPETVSLDRPVRKHSFG